MAAIYSFTASKENQEQLDNIRTELKKKYIPFSRFIVAAIIEKFEKDNPGKEDLENFKL